MFFRKQWRAKPGLHPDSPSNHHDSTKRSRSLFSLPKSLPTTSTTLGDQAEGAKGPLGLSLLYSPTAPEIDLIFVHGLGGNSRKTWSKSSLQSHFWPKEWLPEDPAFKNVRIHSYGYDSYYLKGKEDCLNVHHIGKSFLGAISTSPYIVDSETYIVVIGHSMGGLVMKKAYILAKQDAVHKALVRRFAALYFLATPHRGSDLAKMLKNLLKVAFDRAYVGDLEPNSGAVQVINDEFRHLSAGLELWSFYETQRMKLFSSLIVDPESAVLGYREEKQIPMTADHRSICKFDAPEDSNYVLLRNALASTVSIITTATSERKQNQRRETIKSLKKYLEVSDVLDDELANVCEARMPGSCGWISTKAIYVDWRDGESGNNRTLWIKGKPATGKSVLAGYVIDQLKESGQTCSYFFFKHGDKSKSNLSRCLRSLAFQMASSNAEASDAILKMQADDVCLDRVDERTLWRILFLSGIFQAKMARHYWVIDALDECLNPRNFFNAILSNLDGSIPLRILVTGRDTVDLNQGFAAVPASLIQSLPVLTTDTESDIRLLVERRTQALTVLGPDHRGTLAENILDKSKGSFLWTILVLEELLGCHSRKEIHQVLEDVPRGMKSLYKRTLDCMSQATRGKELAKTILMWAVCAVRPMTISELNGALILDIHDSFPRLEESIAALCGQLVVVDKNGRVKLVHESAREFLVGGGLESEFSIDQTKAHTRMAEVCLNYLAGEEMKPPRNNRRRSSATLAATRLDFAAYAYTSFSYHLSKANPLAAGAFQLVVQFLRSNVLTWIETIAESRNLNHLIRASKHLKTYVNACAVERSPLDPRIQVLRQWTTDFARIPAMFASALTVSPSAIYTLVPPFCPTESMVYNTGGSGRRLEVLGALNKQWDDRLLCIDFRHGQPRALRYGDEFLAVGLSSGAVVLYYATSYQEYKVLEHGEAVNFVAFKTKTNLVATCGMKRAKVWDIRSGQVVHSLASPPRPLGMEFDGERLLIASGNNYIATWDFGHHAQPELVQRPWSDTDPSETNRKPSRGAPCALTISTSHRMLAVAYSGQPIALWDLKEDAYAGSCGKKLSSGETSTHVVVALAFNPNLDIGLLAVAYLDGDLALLDPFADKQLECFRANCQTLASSPNGRLLAAGGANGIINVYEFDTFKVLYRVKSSNSFIKQIAFTRDSILLADIRGAQCTVWEPESLLRESLSDDSSGTTSTTVIETVSMEAKAKVTTMVVHHTSEVIFCGKDDGSVVLYEQKMAASLGTLYSHKSPVRLLVWIERRDALLSVDATNRIFLHRIQKSADKGWLGVPIVLFKFHLDSEKAIMDVLVEEMAAKLLVSTRDSDHLFNLNSGKYERERTYPQMPGTRKWLPHPESSLHMVCINNVKACTYCWSDWSEVSSVALSLDNDTAELRSAIKYSVVQKQRIMLDLLHPNSSVRTNRIVLINADCLAVENNHSSFLPEKQSSAVAALDQVATEDEEDMVTTSSPAASFHSRMTTFRLSVAHVIGIDELGKLVFLNRSFWVCSVDLSESGLAVAQRKGPPKIEVFEHFFVPYDWFAGKRDIICALAKRDIIMTRGGDLAVIRGGLDYAKTVYID
ncbi:WD40-repeat-containing domain protein [Aspergillus californicus]